VLLLLLPSPQGYSTVVVKSVLQTVSCIEGSISNSKKLVTCAEALLRVLSSVRMPASTTAAALQAADHQVRYAVSTPH
jgi:hypothetical protein